MSDLTTEIKDAINRHSRENVSDTPDWILAQFLIGCLETFEHAQRKRDEWHQPSAHPPEYSQKDKP